MKNITKSKTIMDYVVEFCESCYKEKKQKVNALRNINYTRIFKRMFLPFKLVGIDGGTFTNAYRNTYEQSAIE